MGLLRKTFDRAIARESNPKRDPILQKQLNAIKRNAFDGLQTLRDMIESFKTLHSIDERWTSDSPKWKRAESYISIHEYQKALDKLEGLVVQRLFELAKMGLSGTGKQLIARLSSTDINL